MRRVSVILFIIGLVIVSGCQNEDTSKEQATQTEDSTAEQDEEGNENDENNENEENEESEPTDAQGVINSAQEAMSQVNGMAIEGEIESRSEFSGNVMMDEIEDVVGEVTFDPFVAHVHYTATSELFTGTEESEFYLLDQKMYGKVPPEDWMIMPMIVPDHFGTVMTESQFDVFSKHHDQFTMTEENDHYVLDFEGEGEIYKEVIYGGLKDTMGEEAYEAITSIVEGISGSYQFTVDKQTYRVTSIAHESETDDDGMHTYVNASLAYSKFNEVEDVVVPDDVIENAQNFSDMYPIGDE